jgi:hypothetical protein
MATNNIPITQYALSGLICDPKEAKIFLELYYKNGYKNINRLCVKKGEQEYADELFAKINNGDLTFKEANQLYRISEYCGDCKSSLFTSEKEFEDSVAAYLTKCGIRFDRQVVCFSGVADIVTDNYLVELKLAYSDQELRHAIGQVITYGLDPQNRGKRKIVLFPRIPGANIQVFGNDVYAPLMKLDYGDYLEGKYNIFVCDIARFKYIVSLGDDEIDLVTGGEYR